MLIIKIKTILKYLPLILYHTVFAAIVFTNFPWGKFFIGWDALNPEFNLLLNFQRSFFASWQENYGLGTLGGHGFATQLPHTIIISVLSLLLPLWSVRSVFTFLCLYLGGLGMYFLIKLIFKKITFEKYQILFASYIDYIALLVSLFFILNLATVQMFYLQLEAFIVHFAVLPWLFWIIFRLAGKTDKKNKILFVIINFFASIQGFIPSLFVVYAISLSLFAIVYILINKFSLISVKKSLLVLLLTFLVNAYWLLPFSYYQVTRGNLTQTAYNNLMSTEDFILKNKKYGNLENVSLMKGFFFDIQGPEGYVFQAWTEHHSKNEIKIIGHGLFVFVLVSALLSLILIRHVLIKISVVIFLYFLASLATDSPLFSQFTQIMQGLSPSYYQAFRTAFTKFVLGYSFLFSLFLGLGLYILLGYSYRLLKHKLLGLFVFIGLFFLLIYYAFPIFRGNFLYKKLQVNLPQAYFEVMDFFKGKEDGRIADFPQDCPEGWYGYQWKYFGSGFYWYGIKQPILARTFDVWSPNNENYYWEIVQALRSRDYGKVDKILEKYDIRWLLYDQNLIHCRTARGFLNDDEFIKYLEESPKYRLVKTISSGVIFPIKIYENLSDRTNEFIKIDNNLLNIGPKYNWTWDDKAFLEYQDYLTDEKKTPDVYYPFRSFLSSRKLDELEFYVKDKGEYFSFQATISQKSVGSKLIIPSISRDETIEIDPNDLSITRELLPQVFIDGKLLSIDLKQGGVINLSYVYQGNLEVRIPKIRGYQSFDSNRTGEVPRMIPKSCDQVERGTRRYEVVSEASKKFLRLVSVDSNNCIDLELANLSQREAYLTSFENRNVEGKSIFFTLINKTSQKPEAEIYLPKNTEVKTSYMIIPPMQPYGLGYTFHFENTSIGRVKTVNDLGEITVNPIPYRFLTGLKIVKWQENIQSGYISEELTVEHPNPSFYQINIMGDKAARFNDITLVLSQSFDEGWHIYQIKNEKLKIKNLLNTFFPFFFGTELKNHVLVNNWANGWNISNETMKQSNNKTIVILYLPQYLQFLGFGLLISCFLFLIASKFDKE